MCSDAKYLLALLVILALGCSPLGKMQKVKSGTVALGLSIMKEEPLADETPEIVVDSLRGTLTDGPLIMNAIRDSETGEMVATAQDSEQTTLSSTQTIVEQKPLEKKNTPKPYNVILISLFCLAAYLLTYISVKAGKMKKITHRKIWNAILLITALVSCLLGFLLAVQLNYRFGMSWFSSILKLHVEFGIAMTIVAFFHVVWHLKYYKNLFKK